jgi:hypothetical protein
LIIWVIAGLLGMATGLRIGWGLVNQQSVVSSAMIVALGGLAVVAAVNWPPLTLLIDTALHWPNIAIGLSQVALIASAAGSCVMITSVASTNPRITAALTPAGDDGNQSIRIHPADTAKPESAEIFVQTDFPANGPKAYTIHVRIK